MFSSRIFNISFVHVATGKLILYFLLFCGLKSRSKVNLLSHILRNQTKGKCLNSNVFIEILNHKIEIYVDHFIQPSYFTLIAKVQFGISQYFFIHGKVDILK